MLALVLGFTPIFLLFGAPRLIHYVGGTVGYYLRKKTTGRKAQILQLVEADEEEYRKTKEFTEGEKRRDSDEWESVEAYATGTARNGEKAEKEWDGIVGFFHPFCYDPNNHYKSCF